MNVFSKHLSKTPIIPIRPKTPLASSSTSSVSFSNALSNSDEREQPVVECSDTNGSSESDPSSKSSSKLVVGRHQPFPYHKFDHYIPKELKWFFMGPCPEIPFSATTPGAAGSATTPTYTGYSAGVSRGICIELLKHINPGDNQGQRQGSEIFVKRVQFSFKFYSTNARRVSAAIELRDYPIRVIAHRYKVAPFGAIAVDITPNSSTLYPNGASSGTAVLWDPYDITPRTGLALEQDTSVISFYSPAAIPRINNTIYHDKIYKDNVQTQITPTGVGVDTQTLTEWQAAGGDGISPWHKVNMTFPGKGLRVLYGDEIAANSGPNMNGLYISLITDRPAYVAYPTTTTTIGPCYLTFKYEVFFVDAD